MSAITKTRMFAERRCGLKYYDKAIVLAGQTAIIDKTIEFYKLHFSNATNNDRWYMVHWAFVNSVKHIITCNKDISQTYNLMDVLQEQDIVRLQQELNITGNPPDIWSRKP